MADTDNRVAFRAPAELEEWVRGRNERLAQPVGLSRGVQRELDLWRSALKAEQARTSWTLDELGCMADVMNGSLLTPVVLGGVVAMELGDAFSLDPGVWGSKWGIDEDELLRKVRGLSITADLATVDAIARFWDDTSVNARDPQTWRALGFRVTETA